MLTQVVAVHEAFAALGTGKALLVHVTLRVPPQLIPIHEAVAAEKSVAQEGPLSPVPAQDASSAAMPCCAPCRSLAFGAVAVVAPPASGHQDLGLQ